MIVERIFLVCIVEKKIEAEQKLHVVDYLKSNKHKMELILSSYC